jgi:16S rRNA (guanine(966)-N(2))-methyltransferase RsmD
VTAPRGRGRRSGRALANEVRIIGGTWRSRRIRFPSHTQIRPTPDRVRETLFNWLGQDLTGLACLDLFAGSGALGFEAASRGASNVVLLERDRRLAAALTASKLRLKADALRIENVDALAWMARCPPDSFELVFIDPPFDLPLVEPSLALAQRLVVPDGFVYVEAGQAIAPPPGLRLHRQGRAGAVHFHLLQRADSA